MGIHRLRDTTLLALLALALPLAACGRDGAGRQEQQAAVEAERTEEEGWRTDERPTQEDTEDADPYGSEPELTPVPSDRPAPTERVIVVDREPAPAERATEERQRRAQEERELREREERLARREAELRERERKIERTRESERREREAAQREAEQRAEQRAAARREAEQRAEEREAARREAEEAEEVAEAPRRTEVEDEREVAEPEPEPAGPAAAVTVPIGTPVDVEFLDALSSRTSHVGEAFRVRVTRDVYAGGELAVPAGSEISGEVVQAAPLRKVGGRAVLAVDFDEVELPDGTREPITASFLQQGRSETGRDAATIGGAAAGGAILGRILNRKEKSRGAVIGAVIGAVAGTAVAARTPGEEVEIPAGSVVTLALDEPLEVGPRRRR